jgi:transcriptional regulator with XRE-family HTH domain
MAEDVLDGPLFTVRYAANMADAHRDTLGEVIRQARTAKGMKLRELARRVDRTPSYLSDIENDRRIPSEDVLQRIADELDLDFEDLMARAGRFGSDAERYLRRSPAATTLFRRIQERNLSDEEIRSLMEGINELRPTKESAEPEA